VPRALTRLAAAVLLVGLNAATSSAEPTAWARYESRQGRFSVLLPAPPVLTTEDVSGSDSRKTFQQTASARDGDAEFAVSYFDVKAGIGLTVESMRDDLIAAMNGARLGQTEETVGGRRALGFSLTYYSGAVEYLAQARAVIVGARAYLVLGQYARARSYLHVADLNRFMDSFQLRTE
jgi:hypothetical protein